MRSTQEMRDLWAPPGASHNTATFTFWNGVTVRGDRRMVGAVTALDRILHRYRYAPRQGETWGYNNRAITGGTRPSLHAYGIAFDINSRTNPYGGKLVSDMPRAMVEEIEAIVTTGGQRVWRWGGDWNDNNKADDDSHDAMHFETQASPAELARGILVPAAPAITEESDLTPDEHNMLQEVRNIVGNLQAVDPWHQSTEAEALQRVKALQDAIGDAVGGVDTQAVADAILRKLGEAAER